jgi:hypothetical protein
MATEIPNSKISSRGNLPDEIKRWIADNQSELTVEQMAERLNVNPTRIINVINTLNTLPPVKNMAWRDRLKRSKAWRHIKDEFSEDELEYFSDKYIQLMGQFNEDILPTEEQQVIGLIRVEIMQHRNMAGRKQLGESSDRIRQMIDGILGAVNGDMSRLDEAGTNHIIDLQNQLAGLENSQNSKTKEFLELSKEHASLTDKLKASRSQRISAATSDKMTWPEMVKALMDKDLQEKESRKFELRRIAANKELDRLTQPHRYMDNQVDIPILYSGSVDNLDNVENIEKNEDKNLTGDE